MTGQKIIIIWKEFTETTDKSRNTKCKKCNIAIEGKACRMKGGHFRQSNSNKQYIRGMRVQAYCTTGEQ